MEKQIQSALISVFYKDGIEAIAQTLHRLGVTIYSTGGTQQFIEQLGIPCVAVEAVTSYPSILGGRVKTLHPKMFGGILGRRGHTQDVQEMRDYEIPAIDLVIVDLYPFEETVANTNDEAQIIEKIDIGGPSMIRAAAKNHADVVVIASKQQYAGFVELLHAQQGSTTLEQRRQYAIAAFDVCTGYDLAISNYFNHTRHTNPFNVQKTVLRYGENPHQQGIFYGDLNTVFKQLHGKELSYNNLVDVDAAIQLVRDFDNDTAGKLLTGATTTLQGEGGGGIFAIIKHTNVCGAAVRATVKDSWDAALAGDPESAFGGVLVCNKIIDADTAAAIQEIFFEVLVAPGFEPAALDILTTKKNRILLQLHDDMGSAGNMSKTLLNGLLVQDEDKGNYTEWKESGGRDTTAVEKTDLVFANLLCKHLKSNAIALVKNGQLIGKGCGQTSRIDALRHALEKAGQFSFNLNGAVMASDAFFPFNDCVQMGHKAGITAFIQPGGSIRDSDSINYCKEHGLAMVITGMRHFKH